MKCTIDSCDRKQFAWKLCERHYRQEEYKKNPQRHKDACRRYHNAHRTHALLRGAKRRAARQGVPFDLRLEDIVIPERCPILDIPLSIIPNMKDRNFAPSIDRIRPELGYVKGNIAIISFRANRLKNDATLEEVTKLKAWLELQIPKEGI